MYVILLIIIIELLLIELELLLVIDFNNSLPVNHLNIYIYINYWYTLYNIT